MKSSVWFCLFWFLLIIHLVFSFIAFKKEQQYKNKLAVQTQQHKKKVATKQLALDISISRNLECRDIVNGIIDQFDYIEPRPIKIIGGEDEKIK